MTLVGGIVYSPGPDRHRDSRFCGRKLKAVEQNAPRITQTHCEANGVRSNIMTSSKRQKEDVSLIGKFPASVAHIERIKEPMSNCTQHRGVEKQTESVR